MIFNFQSEMFVFHCKNITFIDIFILILFCTDKDRLIYRLYKNPQILFLITYPSANIYRICNMQNLNITYFGIYRSLQQIVGLDAIA